MRKTLSMVSALCLASTSGLVTAEEMGQKAYVGANYNFVTYDEDTLDDELDLGALSGKVGAKINPYVSAELRAGFGVADETASNGSISAKLELDYIVGGYALFGIPNETQIYPYVALGFTKGELTATISGPGGSVSASESESDLSYGVGANVALTDNVVLNAEYMQYIDKDEYEVSGISIGGSYLF
ncbi:MAG TPA: porin family protein [Marinobacter sp.]|uniref:Porin family protein n=1 Tax=Marinobacter aromaticivorans TaxID=1494078 RepID=A0ABW2IZ53_9GAMM|nr:MULTISPECIES: porin family protein [Marinobacter]HET8802701.1 porin family protein [Marinobacter sp.]